MRDAGLEEAQAGIKISGRNINNLRYADDTTFMAESKEVLKNLLMKVKVDLVGTLLLSLGSLCAQSFVLCTNKHVLQICFPSPVEVL